MRKELKKLSLHKEELVSLNSPEMDNIKGGTGWPCVSWAISSWATGHIVDHFVGSEVDSAISYAASVVSDVISDVISWITGDDDDDEPIDGGTLPEVVVTP